MNLNSRLKRLERALGRQAGADKPEPEMSVFDQIRALAAYMQGEGPRPPRDPVAPYWWNPVTWAENLDESDRRIEELRAACTKSRTATSDADRREALLVMGMDEEAVERELCNTPLSGDGATH